MRTDTNKIIPVYTGDTSGVCSALYELDGMTIMHDASGCNSTYNTHDEPRWYDIPSRVFLSGLTEYEAVLGDENKLINDCIETCNEQKPAFIALAPTPIPFVMGQDIKSVATIIEQKTKVPSFGIETNGMNSYIEGAGQALLEWAKRFVISDVKKNDSINIIGATPLDFARYDIVEDIINEFTDRKIKINSVWAMGKYVSNMKNSVAAKMNLVISSVGIPVAKYLEKEFNIPYIVGIPFGKKQTDEIVKSILEGKTTKIKHKKAGGKIAIIGESVFSTSIANLLDNDCTVFTLLNDKYKILNQTDFKIKGEEELMIKLRNFETVIADPLFESLVSKNTKFIEFPHFAFSGRMFYKKIPSIAGALGDIWKGEKF